MQVSGAISDVLVVVPSSGCYRSPDFKNFHSAFDSKSTFLSSKICSSFYVGKLALGPDKGKSRGFMVRCCGQSSENLVPIAPLQLESPAGQLLTQILQTHPHLLPAAIDQQLENLQNDRDTQKAETPSSSQDLLLYRSASDRAIPTILSQDFLSYCW